MTRACVVDYRGFDAGGALSQSFAIETHALEKTYSGGVKALRGVDLRVPAGCCFGLLGPNGAGKSTLVKCLLSIVRPTAGSGTMRGRDIRSAAAREKVGYLPEGHRFPRYLTARGVCEFYGRLSGLSGKALRDEASAKLQLVGLSEWADMKVTKFSKGMSQRVGIAQALMGDPTIVLLDEPTDGVDPVAREGLRTVIKQATDRGATVFINSHLLGEIEVLCDQVAILDGGKVLEQGSVSHITAAVAGDKLRVRIRTDPLPPALWKALQELGAEDEPDDHFVIELESEKDIPPIIDKLRAEGIGIYAIEPRRLRLEEAFIEVIQAASGKRGLDGLHVERRS